MGGMQTTKREREENESFKYKRITTALIACGFTKKYKATFLEHEMFDARFQKCIENFEEMDFFRNFVIPNIDHQKAFMAAFEKTQAVEEQQEQVASSKSAKTALPRVLVSARLDKVEIQVDCVPVPPKAKAEPKDTENDNDGETEVENSKISMPKLKDVGTDRSKINAKSSRRGPSSKNLIASSKTKPQAESGISQLPHDDSTVFSSLKSATFKNQERISPTGKIRVLPLDKMTEDESLEFILKQLEIPESEIPEFKEESKEFIELIGGLPLALQQAVAFIKQEKEERKFLGKSYKISDYVQEFKLCMKKFLSFPPVSGSSASVFVTWNVTFLKVAGLENGVEAIQILMIASFLYADKIPSSFLRDLIPQIEERKYTRALKLLEKYSLIKMNAMDFCLSLHRQLQLVILQLLKECDDVSKILWNLVDKCKVVFQNIKLSVSCDIFLSVHQIVSNAFNLIPVHEKFLDFMSEFGEVLWRASRFSESLDLLKKVYSKSRELLGDDHEKTLRSQHNIAAQLSQLGRYDEALALNKEILKKKETHLGVDHPSTIITKYNMAIVLQNQKKYQESLELYKQVLAQQNKVLGENHPLTLTVQNSIASLHSHFGNFSRVYRELEKKQTEILGPDHRNILTTKHNKATVLFDIGKFEEASKIFNQVYEKQKETLGGNHPDTINTLEWIGRTLEQQGTFKKALQTHKKVYEIRKRNLGEDHPDTIQTKYNMANVLRDQKKYGECLEVLQQILTQKNKTHGENHPETLKTQDEIALLHSHLGDFSQALTLVEKLEKKHIEIFGPDHRQVLDTKHNKACVLFFMGEFQEGSKIFNEVCERQKEIFGDTHLDAIDTLEWIADTLKEQGKFREALNLLNKVYESRKADSGEDHPDTINVKSKIQHAARKNGRGK